MEDRYFGVANHLVGDYQISPKELWWNMCPGSYVVDWIKKDKKNMPLLHKIIGSIVTPAAETVKIGFEGMMGYGLFKIAEEISKNHFIQQGIDKLF